MLLTSVIPVCTLVLSLNTTSTPGHNHDRWIIATPSIDCKAEAKDVVWSFDIPPARYEVCKTHEETLNPPCKSRTGQFLHILSGPGEYRVSASIKGASRTRIVIID